MTEFRTEYGAEITAQKYANFPGQTWGQIAREVADDVCGGIVAPDIVDAIAEMIESMEFIPGGRYLYYAGKKAKFFNNCQLYRLESDTREEWSALTQRTMSALMTGAGIGVDYSIARPKDSPLSRTGGTASGPLALMEAINEIGRRVMQGGSRRSAIYASLNWRHADIGEFIHMKDWAHMPVGQTGLTIADMKSQDFNYHAPMDMTNISPNYDDHFLAYVQRGQMPATFIDNVRQAISTAEPGFSFNFGSKANETLRNAPVSADTWVLTHEGYKQVREIVGVPEKLWTGKQWATATFTKTAENTPTVRVKMTGGREIVADPSHEFLVERWTPKTQRRRLVSIDRVAAANLRENDIVCSTLPVVANEDFDVTQYVRGYAYGDGSFKKNGKPGIDVTFCTDEARECFNAMAGYTFRRVNPCDGRGYLRAYASDSFFENKTKTEFPRLESGLASFLAGLFDADGAYDASRGCLRLSSVHREFLEGARRALETLGIKSGINKAGVSSYGKKEGWSIVVMSSYVSEFARLIPTVRLKVVDHSSYRESTIRVLSVEPDVNQDVFCCDVGVEEHSFCAEGVIISNCTEVTSEDDSDICNLGSLNLSKISSKERMTTVTELATLFLLCGTIRADVSTEKTRIVREKNRRLGLGLMGVHEWLMTRGHRYEMVPELREWMEIYRDVSDSSAKSWSGRLSISMPKGVRAVAPNGTIGIVAGTTTAIEPLFAVAYKRRYLKGTTWHAQHVVDGTAKLMINDFGMNPDKIETALSLANDVERRIKFQADCQDYVDHAISSTINLPAWGTELNNEDRVEDYAKMIAKYAPRLRGLTFYPDGARGGQPLSIVSYEEAVERGTETIIENSDICVISGKGGTCGA